MIKPQILIADDDGVYCELMHSIIAKAGYDVSVVNDLNRCKSHLHAHKVDILLLDLGFPSVHDGFEALEHTHEYHPDVTVIMISGEGHIPDAVRALKYGASDFIEKPVPAEHVLAKIRTLENRLNLEESNRQLSIKAMGMIGSSPVMQSVYTNVISAAKYNTPVLITGETGVGKELVARAIHKLSSVSDKNLITVNCGAIPSELIEAELFGYEQGAFTHAVKARKGYFEYADGGTIFLNEIGELPFGIQSKLLRVLSEGEMQKIGGRNIKIKTRVICDTNKDLQQSIIDQEFREDLYYRISTMVIVVPPLRERVEDIPDLANYFLNNFSAENNLIPKPISSQAMKWLTQQPWKGNVRELKSTIERGVIEAKNDHITMVDLMREDHQSNARKPYNGMGLSKAMTAFEKSYIIKALEANQGNVTQTAKSLGYDKSNLLKKIKKHGIRT